MFLLLFPTSSSPCFFPLRCSVARVLFLAVGYFLYFFFGIRSTRSRFPEANKARAVAATETSFTKGVPRTNHVLAIHTWLVIFVRRRFRERERERERLFSIHSKRIEEEIGEREQNFPTCLRIISIEKENGPGWCFALVFE